ncbi:MAG TPA: HDOD domain-containing protein [Planctomycetota bacterium]|nr:HDOD domain-containing protein [Planctomycetota bacterium]
MTEPHLSRQAVFDRHLGIFGYEILLRAGDEDLLTGPAPDQAGAKLIEKSINTVGLSVLTQGKKGFFNMTRRMLAEDLAMLLPPSQSVVEILHTLEPDDAVVARCKELKKRGYQVAVDAYTARRGMAPLLALADIVKIDFHATDEAEQVSCAMRYGKPGVKLLADKVGSHAELDRARKLGYTLYQGVFFCKPQDLARKEIPAFKLNYLRILQRVNRPEIEFNELDELIRQDLALSLKLLRYVNSAMFALPQRVDSIRQALAMVGIAVIRRWVSLLALAAMSEDKPQELIVTSLIRARFCEQIGHAAGMKSADFELFMVGLLSAVDAILDRPMLEVLADLPLTAEVKSALTGQKDGYGRVLGLALAYEKAEWDQMAGVMGNLSLDMMLLPTFYRESVAWVGQIFIPP